METVNKQLYKKLFLFVSIFIAFAIIFQIAYVKIIFPKGDNGYKELQLSNINYDINYLFIGDSHIQNAVNPEYFTNSYNFSANNENYIQTYFKLKAVINKLNAKPEIVVLPIDISSFSSFRTNRFKNVSRLITFSDWYDVYKQTGNTTYIFRYFIEKLFVVGGNYQKIVKYFISLAQNSFFKYIKGYKPRNGFLTRTNNINKICNRQASIYLKNYDYFDSILIHYFKNILTICENNNIQVVLLKMPLSKEYVRVCRQYVPIEDYYSNINSITNEFNNIITLDYQDVYWNHNEYFRNPDHMNSTGAEIFSQLLSNDLQKLKE